jgi:hypothetical protein
MDLCTNNTCALEKLKGVCPANVLADAGQENNPCLCARQAEKNKANSTQALEMRAYCERNIAGFNDPSSRSTYSSFAPCSCDRMLNDTLVTPLFSSAELKNASEAFEHLTLAAILPVRVPVSPEDDEASSGAPSSFPSASSTPPKEPRDAGYARGVFQRGPSITHVYALDGHGFSGDPEHPTHNCESKSQHELTVVGWNWTAAK